MGIVQRYQAMQRMSAYQYEDLKEVITSGLTDEQKRGDFWQMEFLEGYLTNARMRTIARRLWQKGWCLYEIANTLGIKQSTASCWKKECIHMDELTQPTIVRGRNGKRYPSTKARRRAAQPKSPQGSSPLPSTENDAEAHRIFALQNLSARDISARYFSARIDDSDSVPGDPTSCAYCGATQFAFTVEWFGQIYCRCDSVYQRSTGRWHRLVEGHPRLRQRQRHDAR